MKLFFIIGLGITSLLGQLAGSLNLPPAVELEEGFIGPQEESIFMGTHLSAAHGEQKLEVVGVGQTGIIVQNGNEIETLEGIDAFFFKRSIRYSDRWIRIEELRVKPFNTKAYRFIEQNRAAVALQMSRQDLMQQSLMKDVSPPIGVSADGGETAAVEGAMSQTTQDNLQSFQAANDFVNQLADDLGGGEGSFDALRISMQLEPDRPIDDCYLFLVARYKTLNEPEAIEANHLGLHKIGDLEPGQTTRALFAFKGFPPNCHIIDMRYHFFIGGEEIPTNYSYQRILVDGEQAFDFLYADYISQEHEENREPRLFRRILVDDSDLNQFTTIRETALSLTIREDGSAEWLDPEKAAPEYKDKIQGLILASRFLPAVYDNQLVEQTISIQLGDLMELN